MEFYNTICQKSYDYEVVYIDPPTYIKTLTDSDKKIIFAYKHGNRKKEVSPTTTPLYGKRAKAEIINDANASPFGNPLEDECMVDEITETINMKILAKPWTDQELSYLPISVENARDLINNNINIGKDNNNDTGILWALCNAQNEPDTLLLQTELHSDYFIRGLVKFLGLMIYEEIDAGLLVDKHLSFLRMNSQAINKVNTQIETFFDIESNITIKLSWNSNSTVPALNSYRKASIMSYQSIRIGNPDSTVSFFWRQLLSLDMIKETILKYKEAEDKDDLKYNSGSNLKLNIIKAEILKILTDVTPISVTDDSMNSIDLEPVIKKAEKRQLIDITDQLWMLLKLCSSYYDLKMALNYIFQCAAQCNIVNIPTNQNHMAQLIREISEQRLAVPCLTGAEPLELLLEIGLEKAAKDYEFIYTEAKINNLRDIFSLIDRPEQNSTSTQQSNLNIRKTLHNAATAISQGGSSQANRIRQTMMSRNEGSTDSGSTAPIGFQNSSFDVVLIEKKLSKLAQTHLLMEHLLLIQINLKWGDMYAYVSEQLKKPAMPFKKLKTLSHDKRQIPIISDSFISHVEKLEPNAQRIVMVSSNNFKTVTSTYFFSIQPIFPPNMFSCLSNEDKEMLEKDAIEKEMSKKENLEQNPTKMELYYGLHYLKIQTKKV